MKKKKPTSKSVLHWLLLIVLIPVLSVAAVELIFELWNPSDRRPYITKDNFFCIQRDPLLGNWYKPSCHCNWSRTEEGKVIFDVSFTTDKFGRRITLPEDAQKKKSILFFGCSFTNGTGVNDHENFPFYFANLSKDFNVYNYGGGGFGPQQMLALLTERDIGKEVRSESGKVVGVYAFLGFQIQRASGHPPHHWTRNYPRYFLNSDDVLQRGRTMQEDMPLHYLLSQWGNMVPVIRYVLPPVYDYFYRDEDIYLTAKIFEESQKNFKRLFNSDEFYVMYYPCSNRVNSQMRLILERMGIKILDFSDLINCDEPGTFLSDGHPSAETHRKVAEKLAETFK